MRGFTVVVSFAVFAGLVSCVDPKASSNGVGAVCNPPEPTAIAGAAGCNGDAGCFLGGEIYLESHATDCRTGLCMVYHWDQSTAPDQRSERVFCTCHCDGEGPSDSYCACPSGFTCAPAFAAGLPSVRGSYCVRSVLVPATQP